MVGITSCDLVGCSHILSSNLTGQDFLSFCKQVKEIIGTETKWSYVTQKGFFLGGCLVGRLQLKV